MHIVSLGKLELLNTMMQAALTSNYNLIYRLYSTNVTPVDASTAGSFTECSFTGYVPYTLTRSTWNNAATVSSEAQTSYGSTPLAWTAGSSQTVYGYFVTTSAAAPGGSTGDCLYAELFGTARTLNNGDVLQLTPTFALQSQ